MGWTYKHAPKGTSKIDYFKEECPSLEVLSHGSHGNALYVAARRKDQPEGPTFAVVSLFHRDGHLLGIKIMDEDMGPNESMAPKKILDALSPTRHEHALHWRERCRKRLERQEKAKSLHVGDLVHFPAPLVFSGLGRFDTFRVANKRRHLYPVVNGKTLPTTVRVTKRTWAEDRWKKVEQQT